MDNLQILIPASNTFYTLYSNGVYISKQKVAEGTLFTYNDDSIIYLYYTYPTHRRAYCVRFNRELNATMLPGLSLPVKILIRVQASKVDKLKRTVSFLSAQYSYPDAFYLRLQFILQQKGTVDYEKIRTICDSFPSRTLKSVN